MTDETPKVGDIIIDTKTWKEHRVNSIEEAGPSGKSGVSQDHLEWFSVDENGFWIWSIDLLLMRPD